MARCCRHRRLLEKLGASCLSGATPASPRCAQDWVETTLPPGWCQEGTSRAALQHSALLWSTLHPAARNRYGKRSTQDRRNTAPKWLLHSPAVAKGLGSGTAPAPSTFTGVPREQSEAKREKGSLFLRVIQKIHSDHTGSIVMPNTQEEGQHRKGAQLRAGSKKPASHSCTSL